jgi:hypothetical protein
MTKTERIELRRATTADINDIVSLLQANESIRGGSLTGHFDHAWLAAALEDVPVIVARNPEWLAGVLISSSISAVRHVPAVARMLETYRGGADAYIYGPVCVDWRSRGLGLAEKLFARLKIELPGREGILFIRRDNVASIHAHRENLKMAERGTFGLDGFEYVVLSYRG